MWCLFRVSFNPIIRVNLKVLVRKDLASSGIQEAKSSCVAEVDEKENDCNLRLRGGPRSSLAMH